MAKKRKTLPKDFAERLVEGDVERLKAVFDTCGLDARGGYSKQSALAFGECPTELMRWLVSEGADIHAEDSYGKTPLHSHAGHWRGKVDILLSLGAEVDRGIGMSPGTPLHSASRPPHVANVRSLLAAGASVDALDKVGRTPLETCLLHCSNSDIDRTAVAAEMLLAAGAEPTADCRKSVGRIGESFEFHRDGFNPEFVEETSRCLDHLYEMFDVAPVARRTMHDGSSPIRSSADGWTDRFEEFWRMLVPSSGAAQTVQGEVIRAAGKIRHELDGNGGINWKREFSQMADAWLAHVSSGNPLEADDLAEAGDLVAHAKERGGDLQRMCELAVAWVDRNPAPMPLPTPSYRL